jgi:hypothetical protein
MYIGLHVKYPFSGSILMKIGFSRDFFEKYSNITLHDTSPPEAALFHADSWTDNVEDNSRFCNFANEPNGN